MKTSPSNDHDAIGLSGRLVRPVNFRFSPQLLTLAEDPGPAAEAVRGLRSHLMHHHFEKGRRAVAICAPSAGAGCTFVAVNLAVSLSQIGLKTLLIDADMRQPGVDQFINPGPARPGLMQRLSSDDAVLDEFIEPDVLPDLSVLFAGGVAGNAQELLAKPQFEEVMQLCLRDYEATVIDTPPAEMSADARRISQVAGYSVLVARQNKSYLRDLKLLSARLVDDHVGLVGSVLNEA